MKNNKLEELICDGSDIFLSLENNPKIRTGKEIKMIVKDILDTDDFTSEITKEVVTEFYNDYIHLSEHPLSNNGKYALFIRKGKLIPRRIKS